ncbi:hypothetical protein M407DRAFT_16580 [Tulasnella calospora MUT 4182]|uniref:Superoxide dismutase copper/zinc binding domain-containing protein n=1 Tax=Tulasnella calospora MUT 4182 TaxID=1051891 RepID=A0A0C3QZ10_9AGAM|nr:hypothetical protein M407DRAFT_16580 [Tulasnella calospora MUT 4182]
MFSKLPLLYLSLVPLVSAAPMRRAGLIGTAYVINNDPSGNSILASNIAEDGTLTFGAVTPAGGIGLHGNNTNPNAGDPLFSQHCVPQPRDPGRGSTQEPNYTSLDLGV